MKILMPTIYHPYSGGIAIHVENLIKNLNSLNDSNFEFHILNYEFKGHGDNDNIDRFNADNNIHIHIHHVPCISKIRGISYAYNGYKVGKEIIKNYQIDIIHSHYAFPQGFLGSCLKNKFDIAHVITLHGSDVLRLSKNPVGKYFFNYAVKNCDRIICVSEFLKNNLSKEYQNKSEVIYNGVDFDLFYDIGVDEDYGLFVGSFVSQKGIEILIDAIKNIDFNFKFIGDGVLFDKVSNRLKEENITNIELLGKKHQKEVSEYVKRCSFLILPSLSEGLGMVLLEAMASGKAVIGTNVGGIPELIMDGYNGYLVEPNNPKILKEKIDILIKNNDLRKKFGVNGKIFSKKFSWKNVAKNVGEIYCELKS
jgi:glycosyltransferase involved in cell wall biosynthesis